MHWYSTLCWTPSKRLFNSDVTFYLTLLFDTLIKAQRTKG